MLIRLFGSPSHLLRWLLTLLSTSQLLRLELHRWGGDTGLREECHADTPRLSTSQVGQTCPHISDSQHVDSLGTTSHSKLSKTCLGSWLVSLWWMVIAVPSVLNQKLSSTFPFLSTKDLDLAGLKHIWAHSTIFLSPCRIQRQPGTDSVLTLRSSMNLWMPWWVAGAALTSSWALCTLV